jgi:hypothetical protein
LETTAFAGALPHIILAGSDRPLAVRHFDGRWRLHNGSLEIHGGRLETPEGVFDLSGTASFGQVLDLKLARDGAPRFDITGTVTQPRVAAVSTAETQAALKP